MLKVIFLFSTVLVAATAAPTADDDGSNRVVGGTDAKVDEFPYIASLRISGDSHICAGSILNSRTIVTAAHCVDGLTPKDLSVVAGSIYLKSGGTKYQLSKITPHPDYNAKTDDNDIAVIITSEAITPSSSVGFISLPTGSTGAGVEVTLSGWGRTSFPGDIPNTLQKITLLTLSEEDCKKKLPPGFPPALDTNLCTLTKAGEGACKGDSGGPLADGKVLVGVVNRGEPCAKGVPDVFARVSSFVSWINENTQT